MPGFRHCNQTDSCKILSASLFSVVVVVYGVLVSVWISTFSGIAERDRDLHSKKLSLACHVCFTYSKSTAFDFNCTLIERNCTYEGWRKGESLPASCKDNENVKNFVEQEVRRVFDETKNEFETKRLDPDEFKYLQNAEESFYTPSRTIIHWSPSAKAFTTTEWQSVEEFSHDGTVYPISPGNTNSYSNGTVNITETGLYLIYARLSFACNKVDHRKKRIHMEVVVQENPESHFVILKDLQTATCSLKEDLITMYESGVFRLGQDDKIELRYKVPDGVELSNGDTRGYKSSIGLIRLGLA